MLAAHGALPEMKGEMPPVEVHPQLSHFHSVPLSAQAEVRVGEQIQLNWRAAALIFSALSSCLALRAATTWVEKAAGDLSIE